MEKTIGERIVDAMPFLDRASDAVQPKVQELVDAGGATARYVLDGVWFEVPLHPVLTDVPIGSWTAALVFDGLDLVSGRTAMRNAADASLTVGVAGGFVAAAVGFSDWRYLSGGSRRMGMSHAVLNSAGLLLNTASLLLRATGRRNAGRLAFLAGYSLNGMGAHLGGELSYKYGLRVNRNAFEETGPGDYVPVLDEADLSAGEMRRIEVDGADVLLSRSEKDGRVCAIAATCNHMGGPLEKGDREGDTVVCPWHLSRFDLCSGKAINGPAVFPQSGYETRVREGRIEVKAVEENIQEKIT
ncbi:MAG: Ferredoxin, 2Fe-2S [uncultured Rubrobacteraceae bacterium]|uniref:Ferredoxin, 2Fe-2S n=1 Tax=uncultured Rubrobacteraceae bacterium TaxID=349277 RepID=A0A6J4PPR5_9ACTN|nr:MAG: Ferredoxin, 2Fe-2S [uncultured Rubrobacteraceae bacterium]